MSVGVSLCRFIPRARSFNERPCWYSAATAATSEGVSRRWTGFVGRRAAPPAVGESTPSTSAQSALEPGFECCPLLFGSPAPGRFEDHLAAICGFRPAAGSTRNPCSGAVSRVSGGFESRPQRSTRCQEYNISPVEGALLVTDRSCRLVPHSNLCVAGDLQGRSRADEFESSGVRIAGSGGPGGPFCISDVAIIAQSTDPRCGALCHRMAVLPAILTMWLVAPRPRLARGP